MKLKFLNILIITIFYSYLLMAQEPCGENTLCPQKKYPYFFCNPKDKGRIMSCCVFDPINEHCEGFENDYPNVRKMNLPICAKFIDSGPETATSTFCKDGCSIKTSYHKTDFSDDMEKAIYRWNCLCGYQDSPCSCTISIKFSNEPDKFSNYKNHPSDNSLYRHNPPNSDQINPNEKCSIDCDKITIYLNQCTDFTLSDDPNKYRNFFINDKLLDDKQYDGYDIHAYNLFSIIAYELGRIMGLGDMYKQSDYRPENCDNTEYDVNSIMSSEYHYPRDKRNLSNDDICQFKKLYCPNLVPVKENNEENDNKTNLYPNPFNNLSCIDYTVNKPFSHVNITVFNELGEKIIAIENSYKNIGNYKVYLNGNEFLTSIYFVRIIIDNFIEIKKVVVNR